MSPVKVHMTRKPSISTHVPATIPTILASPWCPSPDEECSSRRQPSRFGGPVASESSVYRSHWLSRLRSALRLLIVVLSGGVTVMLAHTLHVYRGNRYLDLRNGELPMIWPAHTNLAPTLILFSIAAANFLASVAIMTISFTKSFRRPMRSRDIYRIVAGSFGVILWVTALVVSQLLDKASKASLGRYSCTNKNILSNGRYQYRAVCEEQGVAFYLAVGAGSAEVLTLSTLAISAIFSARNSWPKRRITEKKDSISINVAGRSA